MPIAHFLIFFCISVVQSEELADFKFIQPRVNGGHVDHVLEHRHKPLDLLKSHFVNLHHFP
jgi:hypothetical protein